MLRIDANTPHALYGAQATRRIEQAAQAGLAPHTLMQRAGLSLARLALALAPHSDEIWLACGPGNNGGDGLEAAMHLQRWGKRPVVTWLNNAQQAPGDAKQSYQRAAQAGVTFADKPPVNHDLCIDALLGLGISSRAPDGQMASWIALMNGGIAPVLAVDLPTGLNPDTGAVAPHHVRARHTLSLLTLKPGLFTGHGRDAGGTVWLDDLGTGDDPANDERGRGTATARLAGATHTATRLHASHKGSRGDVAILGGAPGMTGAALLAASAALHAGAGRVFVCLLDGGSLAVDTGQPELMFRAVNALDFSSMTVVCGCGGGDMIHSHMSSLLSTPAKLVIDADAINCIAHSSSLQSRLSARAAQTGTTVLTPHPLEAARLLGTSTRSVQADRLAAAQQLAQRFGCTVVLKGSGSIVAAPGQLPVINATGNARLASAGTGDVLAGMVGAGIAGGLNAFEAACQAVYQHGRAADDWPAGLALCASALARSFR